MNKQNNVSLFKPEARSTKELTSLSAETLLQSIVELIKRWRENKKNVSEKIPMLIWDKIFILLKEMPAGRILSTLNISRKQFKAQQAIRQKKEKKIDSSEPARVPSEDFCEANRSSEFPLEAEPAETFSTKTCVVELYRPDGRLMKIHICTDRFEELLNAFYAGSSC